MLRSIALKTFPAIPEKFPEMASADLLKMVVESPVEKGFDYASISKTMKISGALESAKASGADAVKLDEDHWLYLKERVNAMRWAVPHMAFVELTDDVNNAAKVDPNAA